MRHSTAFVQEHRALRGGWNCCSPPALQAEVEVQEHRALRGGWNQPELRNLLHSVQEHRARRGGWKLTVRPWNPNCVQEHRACAVVRTRGATPSTRWLFRNTAPCAVVPTSLNQTQTVRKRTRLAGADAIRVALRRRAFGAVSALTKARSFAACCCNSPCLRCR